MKKTGLFPVIYMFLVTAFFSSIVIGFARYTQERVESNQQIFFEAAVLRSLNIAGDLSNPEIHEKFKKVIEKPTEDSHGAYLYRQDGVLRGYALPVDGKGFWAPIKGLIGIKPDKRTVIGIAFYEQNETPGLGAEIKTEDFRKQFENIKISVEGKPIQIKPVGTELGENDVQAISGATQTCTRLEDLINDDINKWQEKMQGK